MAPPFLSKPNALFAPEQTPILGHLYYKGSHPSSFVLCILLAISGILVIAVAVGFLAYTYKHYNDYAEYMPSKKSPATATTTITSEEKQILPTVRKDDLEMISKLAKAKTVNPTANFMGRRPPRFSNPPPLKMPYEQPSTSKVEEAKPTPPPPPHCFVFMDPAKTFPELYKELEYYIFFHRQLYYTFFIQRRISAACDELWSQFCGQTILMLEAALYTQDKILLMQTKNLFVANMGAMDTVMTEAVHHRTEPEPALFYGGGRKKFGNCRI